MSDTRTTLGPLAIGRCQCDLRLFPPERFVAFCLSMLKLSYEKVDL